MYRVVVLDLDGTLISGRSILILSDYLGVKNRIIEILNLNIEEKIKSKMIASLLKGIKISELNDPLKGLISSEWNDIIGYFRGKRMKVGVITISYDVIASKILEGLNLDFIDAVPLKVKNGVIVGDIVTSNLILETPWCIRCPRCKRISLNRISQSFNIKANESVIAIGDGLPDACMFIDSALSIAINPKSNIVKEKAKITVENVNKLKMILKELVI